MKAVRAVLGAQACSSITLNSGSEGGKGAARSQGMFQQDPTLPPPSSESNGTHSRPPVPPEVCSSELRVASIKVKVVSWRGKAGYCPATCQDQFEANGAHSRLPSPPEVCGIG